MMNETTATRRSKRRDSEDAQSINIFDDLKVASFYDILRFVDVEKLL